jgi:hypothetical protein
MNSSQEKEKTHPWKKASAQQKKKREILDERRHLKKRDKKRYSMERHLWLLPPEGVDHMLGFFVLVCMTSFFVCLS